MKPDRDIERLLDSWFADGPIEVPDRVIDVVADRIARQPQRPAWRLNWKDIHVNSTQRMVATAAAVILVAVVALAIAGRPTDSGIGNPAASPSPVQTTTPPSPAPTEIVYTSKAMEVPISFRLVDGFLVDFDIQDGIGFTHPDLAGGIGSLASLQVVGAAVGDPQAWPVDLVSWLETQPYLTLGEARSTTVGGYPATVIDMDVAPATQPPRTVFLWRGGSWDRQAFPERWRFVEIRTGPGEGINVVIGTTPDKFDDAAASLDRLLATLEFVAPPSPSPSP